MSLVWLMICIQGYCSLSVSSTCHVPSDEPLSETHTPTPKASACGNTDFRHSSSAFLLLCVGIQIAKRGIARPSVSSILRANSTVSAMAPHFVVCSVDSASHAARLLDGVQPGSTGTGDRGSITSRTRYGRPPQATLTVCLVASRYSSTTSFRRTSDPEDSRYCDGDGKCPVNRPSAATS